MRKFLIPLLLIALLSVAATAQDGMTVSLWHGWTGADNTEMLNIVLDKFNMENEDGITIEATALDWDDLFSQLVLSAAAGNPPDVVMFHNSEVPDFAGKGILRPLDDIMEMVPVNLEGVPQNIIDISYVDGQFYCLPGDLHMMGLYYNKDLAAAAGLDPESPPTTGEEFLTWARAMTITDDSGETTQWGFDLPVNGALPRWLWFSLLHQFGGSFLGEDGLSAVDSEASHKALQTIVDIGNEGLTSKGSLIGDVGAFWAERAGMLINGPWNVNGLTNAGINFGVAHVPTFGDGPATWANTHCLSLTNQDTDERYESGMKFIRWFFNNYALPAVSVGIIPVSPDAQADPIFTDDPRYEHYIPFVESLQFSVLEPVIPQYTAIFSFAKPTALVTNLEAAMVGDKTVEQALADMKVGVDEQLLDEY